MVKTNNPSYIFIQIGARRNYAVPALMAKANLLKVFYTDICASAGLGKFMNKLIPARFRNAALTRLLNRQVPDSLREKIHTFDLLAIQSFLANRRNQHKVHSQYHELANFNHAFSKGMIEKGTGDATHVFSMFTEGLEFVQYAKRKGLTTVMEVYISPIAWDVVQRERQQNPGSEQLLEESLLQGSRQMWDTVRACIDHYIVPSEFVIDGLEAYGIKREQVHLVPYAVHDSWFNVLPAPKKGRVLFVGTAELRKGIHILAAAAAILKGKPYEFRVIGHVTPEMRRYCEGSGLHFTGRVPRHEIQNEFAQADIFVLPSLAEGSAEVTYEALAAGLPVITTKAAGSVVRDNQEGFIVPERDASVLAEKIEHLLENRSLRDQMALAARQRARDFTWDKYGQRLIKVLSSF
jgi:glycosyltransferase involved in cell wall biosynthesis